MESARERRLKKGGRQTDAAFVWLPERLRCRREALGIFSRAPRGHETSKTPRPALKPRGIKELVQDKHTTRLYFIFYLAELRVSECKSCEWES